MNDTAVVSFNGAAQRVLPQQLAAAAAVDACKRCWPGAAAEDDRAALLRCPPAAVSHTCPASTPAWAGALAVVRPLVY
jgi:hypothetical protein